MDIRAKFRTRENRKGTNLKSKKGIDDYAKQKSPELVKDFFAGIKNQFSDITTYGLGRPWGTEIRQRLALAVGLKNEVNNLVELGLNSVANSKHVYLGDHFIQLIKKDLVMKKVIAKVETEVKRNILSRQNHLSCNALAKKLILALVVVMWHII